MAKITESDRLNAEIAELRKKEGVAAGIELQQKMHELKLVRERHAEQIASVERLICKLSKKFATSSGKPYEEIKIAAYEGALRAAETFTEGKRSYFSHAHQWIRQAIGAWFQWAYQPMGYYRTCRVERKFDDVPQIASLLHDNHYRLISDDRIKNPADVVEKKVDTQAQIDKIKKVLSRSEYEILFRVLGTECRLRDIGGESKVSRERIRQKALRSIAKIRRSYPDMLIDDKWSVQIRKMKESRKRVDRKITHRIKLSSKSSLSVQAKSLFED